MGRKVIKGELEKKWVIALVKALLEIASSENTGSEEVIAKWVSDTSDLEVDGKTGNTEGTTLKKLLNLIEKEDKELISETKKKHEEIRDKGDSSKRVSTLDEYKIDKVRNFIKYLEKKDLLEDLRHKNKRNQPYWKFKLKLKIKVRKETKDKDIEDNIIYVREKMGFISNERVINTSNKTLPTNQSTDPEKMYQAAELLRSFDCREQEKSIMDELENDCRGFFIIQAHTSMQKWFIWRLTKCMGNFEKIKKIQIKLNPTLLRDVDNIWGEIGKYIGLTSNIDRQSLAKYLIDYSKGQAIIIVIDKFEMFNKQKTQKNHLNKFLDSWSYIFTQFQDIDRTKYEPFALFLVENEVITKDEDKIEAAIFNLTKIPDSQNKFNTWEREHIDKLEKQFNWSKDLKSDFGFDEKPYDLVEEICNKVFKLDIDGEIKQYWQIK